MSAKMTFDPRRRASPLGDGFIVYVAGMPGTGKTTWLSRCVVRDVAEEWRRCVVYDPTGDVLTRLTDSSATTARVPRDWCGIAHTEADVWRLLERSDSVLNPRPALRVVVLQPRAQQAMGCRHSDKKPRGLGDEFLAVLNSEKARGFTLFADEAELIFRNTPALPDEQLQGIKLVRNRQQRLYATTQRPQTTSTLLRMNATHACIFAADSKAFIERGCSELGDVELFEPARRLVKFRFLYRCPPWARTNPDAPLPVLDARTSKLPW